MRRTFPSRETLLITSSGGLQPFTVRCCETRQSSGSDRGPPVLRARGSGPVVMANVLGCILSVVLLILSLMVGDGMSLLATLLLSIVSVFVGVTNHWRLRLPARPARTPTQTEVVIRWPNASFLILRCSTDIARGLFFSPENFVRPTVAHTPNTLFQQPCIVRRHVAHRPHLYRASDIGRQRNNITPQAPLRCIPALNCTAPSSPLDFTQIVVQTDAGDVHTHLEPERSRGRPCSMPTKSIIPSLELAFLHVNQRCRLDQALTVRLRRSLIAALRLILCL